MSAQTSKTKRLATLAMLAALAYVVMLLSKMLPPFIPAVPFLDYDPKHVIVAITGFVFGPLPAFSVAFVASFLEMITVSHTSWIGLIMNVLATSSFACAAALVYKKKHDFKGAVIGLVLGSFAMTAVMVLWNALLTPLFMNWPRAEVLKLILPGILPFNLIQAGLNTALTLILYKPVVTALRKIGLAPSAEGGGKALDKRKKTGLLLFALLLLITCVLVILAMQGLI